MKYLSAPKIMKASMMILGAGFMMGNQKCEQKATPERSLKKIVELGAIRSSPVIFPNGGAFDFEFVANQQIYSVMLDSEKFALRTAPPISSPPTQARDGDSGFYNLNKADGAMMKAFAQQAGKENYSVQYSETAWCMANLPQAKISGAVNSFEMLGGGGLSIGFTPAGNSTAAITGASFQVQFAQLDLSMIARAPLSSSVLAAANVTSKQTKTAVNFGLMFGAFTLGPSAYYQTPLATVTKKGLKTAVDELSSKLDSEEWYTRVMADFDTHIVVVGGTDVNLEPGDQLLIYNEDHFWDGEPCNSRYRGGGAAANAAVAKIELDWVGTEISRGRVIEQSVKNPVIGAKVKLFKLHAADYVPAKPGVQGVN